MIFMLGGLVALVVILLVVFIPSMEKNARYFIDGVQIAPVISCRDSCMQKCTIESGSAAVCEYACCEGWGIGV